jgi:hypothetical protein
LGPVIGIFVGEHSIHHLNKQKALWRTIELFEANKKSKTILYYFCIDDVLMDDRMIEGTYYNHHKKLWVKHTFPLPDVLYDRGSGQLKKRKPKQHFRDMLEETTSAKKLNAVHYFDKWDLHQKLSKYKEMKPHLPLTIRYTGPEDFKKFKQAKVIYIKQGVSSNGRKIMRVEKIKSARGGYKYSYYSRGIIQRKAKSLNDIIQEMKKLYNNNTVILQESIDLPNVEGKLVDMRATVQRTGSGSIRITAIVVRVGEKGSPVTSTKSGSTCYRLEEYYQNRLRYSPAKVRKLRKRVETFLKKVYNCTEKSYGQFGELGIDFALDKQGKLWFIECNAKPAKDALHQAYDKKTVHKAFRYPLEYAKHLSGF